MPNIFASSESPDIPFTDLLTWTFGNTSYDPEKPLFIDASSDGNSISHNQAKTIVRKLIGGLKANGLQAGDSVCLHSSNNINYALVFFAVIGAGGCFVGSNPQYTASELAHLFKLSEVKYIIVEGDLLGDTRIAADEAGIHSQNMFIFNTAVPYEMTDYKTWSVLLNHGESDWIKFDDEDLAKNTVAALMSTSGTTGLPKAAQTSHYTQVAQSVMLGESAKPYEVRRLLCLPQFHAFNAPLSLIAPLREGCSTFIMKRYVADQFTESIQRLKPTETTMVNPIMFKLLKQGEENRIILECLRAIWCGGVPLDVTVQNEFRGILHPDAIVKQVWGLTEIGWATTLKYPERDDTGSAGRLLPGVEARIIDEKGVDVLEDTLRGEILLRSPSMMIGYLKNDTATTNTIKDGWLHTGDIGYQREGKWYIVDRIKELIKVRGWQVSPAEIETCLLTHPAIIDVAVIGVDFEDERGELPRAYVVLDPELELTVTDEEIAQHLVGKLSRFKAIAGGVRRVSTLPRSSTGKILKNVFRDEVKLEVLEFKLNAAKLKSATTAAIESIKTDEELSLIATQEAHPADVDTDIDQVSIQAVAGDMDHVLSDEVEEAKKGLSSVLIAETEIHE